MAESSEDEYGSDFSSSSDSDSSVDGDIFDNTQITPPTWSSHTQVGNLLDEKMYMWLIIAALVPSKILAGNNTFPPDFLIGCASSAMQIEGAWNTDGKGVSVWDYLAHNEPQLFANRETPDVACDSYHKYKEDVQNVKYMGLTHYRFSISWTRILSSGYENDINQAGVNYYHNLIDELHNNGIIPVVTIYHFDLPQNLQELGGWPNPLMADYYMEYARIIFREFGDKVKWWITINEPYLVALGYGEGFTAPAYHQHGVGDYLAAHTLLRAHAKVYHLYDTEFRPSQNGKIGICLSAEFSFPLKNVTEDILAADRKNQFTFGIFAHPIFSKKGDYPPIVRKLVDTNSKNEGLSTSRLPTFTTEEIDSLRGSFDFWALNHYTSLFIKSGLEGLDPSWERDSRSINATVPSLMTNPPHTYVFPKGFRAVLNYIRTQYGNPPVLVTENGYSTDSKLYDWDRVQYLHDYIKEMLKAIYEDGCNVFGYTVWSLMDNFELYLAYTVKYGLYHVDFNSPNRTRTKKLSADFMKQLTSTRKLPDISEFKKKYMYHKDQ